MGEVHPAGQKIARHAVVTSLCPAPRRQDQEKFLNGIIQDSLGALLICLASICNTLLMAILTVIYSWIQLNCFNYKFSHGQLISNILGFSQALVLWILCGDPSPKGKNPSLSEYKLPAQMGLSFVDTCPSENHSKFCLWGDGYSLWCAPIQK